MYNVCINMVGVTTAIVLDTRVRRKDNTYSVKLRITFNREQRYFPLNVFLSEEDWNKTKSEKPRAESKELRLFFNKIEAKAIDIIRNTSPFSFQSFIKEFDKRSDKNKDLFYLLRETISSLSKEERHGTASSYQCCYNSIERFLKDRNFKRIQLVDITVGWLKEYEKWMIDNGNSLTTVGIYLRCIRAIFNQAISEVLLAQEFYPFGKRKYQIPVGRNVKKAIDLKDIKRIMDYAPKTKMEEWARDMWIFSYLCNGANIKDIAKLQFQNIDKNKITFIRSKTEYTTRKDLKPIVAMLLPETHNIIQKWSNNNSNQYVFNIITKEDTSIKSRAKVLQAVKTINKYMKRIGKDLNIEVPLTTYAARHSFATVLKRSGAPIEFISESLGHKSIQTTDAYLGSFEDSTRENYQKELLNF